MPLEVVIRRWGSPAAFWISIIASPPAAAALLMTTIGWLTRLFFWIAPWIVRAIWSEEPPGGKGTMISIGFVGSQAARAGVAQSRASAVAAKAFIGVPRNRGAFGCGYSEG